MTFFFWFWNSSAFDHASFDLSREFHYIVVHNPCIAHSDGIDVWKTKTFGKTQCGWPIKSVAILNCVFISKLNEVEIRTHTVNHSYSVIWNFNEEKNCFKLTDLIYKFYSMYYAWFWSTVIDRLTDHFIGGELASP